MKTANVNIMDVHCAETLFVGTLPRDLSLFSLSRTASNRYYGSSGRYATSNHRIGMETKVNNDSSVFAHLNCAVLGSLTNDGTVVAFKTRRDVESQWHHLDIIVIGTMK